MTTDREKLIENLIEYLTDGVSDEPRAIALDVIDLCRNAALDEVKGAVNDLDMLEKKYDECTSALGNQYIRGRIEKTRDAIEAIDNLGGTDE